MPANSIYYGQPSGMSAVATSAQSGYPAANVLTPQLGRSWRSVDTTANTVTVTWSTLVTVQALWLSDINFNGSVDYTTNGGTTWTNLGTISAFMDKWTGRYRGYLDVNLSINGIRFTPSASPLDSATYWRCGAAYVFTGITNLPRMPEMGMQVNPIYPYTRQDLANGKEAVATSGFDRLTFTFNYLRRYDQDMLEIVRRARAGTIGFALQPNNFTEVFAPVRYVENTLTDTFSQLNFTTPQIVLKEAV